MYGRNHLGCRDSQCFCDHAEEFARGEEVAGSLRDGRMARWASIDIEEIRSRSWGSKKIDGVQPGE